MKLFGNGLWCPMLKIWTKIWQLIPSTFPNIHCDMATLPTCLELLIRVKTIHTNKHGFFKHVFSLLACFQRLLQWQSCEYFRLSLELLCSRGRCSTRVSIPACHSSDLSLIPNNKFNLVLTILIGFKIGLLSVTAIDEIWCVNKYYNFSKVVVVEW